MGSVSSTGKSRIHLRAPRNASYSSTFPAQQWSSPWAVKYESNVNGEGPKSMWLTAVLSSTDTG